MKNKKELTEKEQVQKIIETMKFENLAKNYVKLKKENTNFRDYIKSLKTEINDKQNENDELILKTKRLQNQIKYKNKKYHLEIEYIKITCPFSDYDADCGNCEGANITIEHKNIVCCAYQTENREDEQSYECNTIMPLFCELWYIDENYDEQIKRCTKIKAGNNILYNAPKKLIEEFF